MKYHFVGIKGSGMSALAMVLKGLGNDVKGSDYSTYMFTEDLLVKEGIEILTGVPAGKRDKNGNFPAGTVNHLVYEKLKKYAKISAKISVVDLKTLLHP